MQPWVGLGGHRPTHWGAMPGQSQLVFPHKKRVLLQTEIILSTPLDVKVLGWRGYAWSAVVMPVGRTTKFSNMTSEVEKLTLNSLATALVDIPAVSMPIAHSLKT